MIWTGEKTVFFFHFVSNPDPMQSPGRSLSSFVLPIHNRRGWYTTPKNKSILPCTQESMVILVSVTLSRTNAGCPWGWGIDGGEGKGAYAYMCLHACMAHRIPIFCLLHIFFLGCWGRNKDGGGRGKRTNGVYRPWRGWMHVHNDQEAIPHRKTRWTSSPVVEYETTNDSIDDDPVPFLFFILHFILFPCLSTLTVDRPKTTTTSNDPPSFFALFLRSLSFLVLVLVLFFNHSNNTDA